MRHTIPVTVQVESDCPDIRSVADVLLSHIADMQDITHCRSEVLPDGTELVEFDVTASVAHAEALGMTIETLLGSKPALRGRPAITSRHYGWQRRWAIDHAAGTYTHECGLLVQFLGPDDTRGRATNAPQVQAALAVKNGHNAAAMIQRMLREAAELRANGSAARLNTKGKQGR